MLTHASDSIRGYREVARVSIGISLLGLKKLTVEGSEDVGRDKVENCAVERIRIALQIGEQAEQLPKTHS